MCFSEDADGGSIQWEPPALSHCRPAKTPRTWQPEGTSEIILFHILLDQEAQDHECYLQKTPFIVFHPALFWNVLEYCLHFGDKNRCK